VAPESKDLVNGPAFNPIAEGRDNETMDEDIVRRAHVDSGSGSTGPTHSATASLVILKAVRILKVIYHNPKRSILVGLWGSEEQGLNGSRAFVEDHPEIVNNIQAVFNQDNGTGRVVNISGQGFLHAYDFIGRWLTYVPEDIK